MTSYHHINLDSIGLKTIDLIHVGISGTFSDQLNKMEIPKSFDDHHTNYDI